MNIFCIFDAFKFDGKIKSKFCRKEGYDNVAKDLELVGNDLHVAVSDFESALGIKNNLMSNNE